MIKGSEAQKQRPYELLWMLRFDEKSISIVRISIWNWIKNEQPRLGKVAFVELSHAYNDLSWQGQKWVGGLQLTKNSCGPKKNVKSAVVNINDMRESGRK